MSQKTAIVLCNLGGPASPQEVRGFLFRLFFDPAIIRLPKIPRWLLAQLISRLRAKKARGIYQEMGGGSPILPNTQAQAALLRERLNQAHELGQTAVFIAMRYTAPRANDVVRELLAFEPAQIIMLPLYPQFSTTTTASSWNEWKAECAKAGLNAPTKLLCCYPTQPLFVQAHVDMIRHALEKTSTPVRVLFSAHGLPESIVKQGDPYAWQVEKCVEEIVKKLSIPALDYVICYQSRVGPKKWIGPATPDEITRAGAEAKAVILVPIAFVSEHSETLVELDIEYGHLAKEAGVKEYVRVPALGVNETYIESLAQMIKSCIHSQGAMTICSSEQQRLCPRNFSGCMAA